MSYLLRSKWKHFSLLLFAPKNSNKGLESFWATLLPSLSILESLTLVWTLECRKTFSLGHHHYHVILLAHIMCFWTPSTRLHEEGYYVVLLRNLPIRLSSAVHSISGREYILCSFDYDSAAFLPCSCCPPPVCPKHDLRKVFTRGLGSPRTSFNTVSGRRRR